MALARSETQTASSRIWTLAADSISYVDYRYHKRAINRSSICGFILAVEKVGVLGIIVEEKKKNWLAVWIQILYQHIMCEWSRVRIHLNFRHELNVTQS